MINESCQKIKFVQPHNKWLSMNNEFERQIHRMMMQMTEHRNPPQTADSVLGRDDRVHKPGMVLGAGEPMIRESGTEVVSICVYVCMYM